MKILFLQIQLFCAALFFIIFNSCNSQCEEHLLNRKRILNDAFTEIYKDSFQLSLSKNNDTLSIKVNGLPEYVTGEDYNLMLYFYSMNKIKDLKVDCFNHVLFSIHHNYNDIYYKYDIETKRLNFTLSDYEIIKNEAEINRFLLKNFNDLDAAFVSLAFDPIKDYYPNFSLDESLYNLLLKLNSTKNGGSNGYTEREIKELEFAFMWLYYVSDFSFDDLSLSKEKLDMFMEISDVKINKNLNRDDLNNFYNRHLK